MPPTDRSEDISTRPILLRLGALGGAALLATATGACQVIQNARTGLEVSDAVDELLSWEGVTIVATVGADAEQVHDYLLRSGAEDVTEQDARLLADLELTVSAGDPEDETPLKDLAPGDPLNGAITVNFGGRDVAGVKLLGEETYARVGGQAIIEDVYGSGEAAVARAERFERDAAGLPDSLRAAATALRGDWVEIEPYDHEAYAEALTEHAGVPADTAANVAAALIDGAALLDPESLWESVGALESTLRSSASLRHAGQERGAETVVVEMPAGAAYRAVEPLLGLLAEQTERFGLPPLVAEPADPDAPVTAELSIRNGVLTNATMDVGQFAGEDAGSLPLDLFLAGGSALNLNPPENPAGLLTPDDLAVALMYLAEQDERRQEDEDRADVPGPMQP
ncbi:hypothetical protein [Streptomyces litchfieldiae]|uniref:Uncharacterized protein n=1 Tax=Streptomyces litchfieldiae TaxID=3075543 RepID=A0ABU2MYE5_9ACTN|nr:hypothetical protein [Streptomyces sp. DSM 44938]MDT0346670.1 hypothetical protein [Streptomyces sp. DSM 44938]